MLRKEALVSLATLSQLVAEKREELISHLCGLVNGRIAIAVAQSYYFMICGSPLPCTLWYCYPYWDSGLGLGLV